MTLDYKHDWENVFSDFQSPKAACSRIGQIGQSSRCVAWYTSLGRYIDHGIEAVGRLGESEIRCLDCIAVLARYQIEADFRGTLAPP